MITSSRPSPETLEAALQQAREALARDPRGDLPRGYREAIWAALGPRDELGRFRRTILGIKAIEHVLPEWQRAWPRDRTPHRLLAQAAAVFERSIDPKQLLDELNRARTAMDDLSNCSQDKTPVSAGYGAVQVLATAIDDEAFDPALVRLERCDDKLQPDERDPGYFAAVVKAGGPPWAPESTPVRRREFWEWWLRNAVPAAWAQPLPLALGEA